MFHFCCSAYWGEDARVASQPGRPGVDPGTARCGPPIEGLTVVGRRCRLRDGIRQTCGSPAPGNYLAAVPKPRRVQLLVGWPVGQGSLQLPVVVSALPWA
jgi:hypothetical protein